MYIGFNLEVFYWRKNGQYGAVTISNSKELNEYRKEVQNMDKDDLVRAKVVGQLGEASVSSADELLEALYKYYLAPPSI